MKRKQETTKDTTEEKLETKLEPAQDWTKILYGPRTDLDRLDLDNNESHFNKDEKFHFIACPSHTVININLTSADSRLRKIGIRFILCRDTLNCLKQGQFQKNKEILLFHVFAHGIINFFLRIISTENIVIHKLPPQFNEMLFSWYSLTFNADFFRFTHYHFNNDRFESLPPGAVPDISELFIQNEAFIRFEDFKMVITRQLPDMPYSFFVKNYVTCFQRILHLINSKGYKVNVSNADQADLFIKDINDSINTIVKFFTAMKEPFLGYKTRILTEERELLFAGFKLFPAPLEEIIHHYADSRALCFFNPERETEALIYDHNYPEPQSNEEKRFPSLPS